MAFALIDDVEAALARRFDGLESRVARQILADFLDLFGNFVGRHIAALDVAEERRPDQVAIEGQSIVAGAADPHLGLELVGQIAGSQDRRCGGKSQPGPGAFSHDSLSPAAWLRSTRLPFRRGWPVRGCGLAWRGRFRYGGSA